MYTYKHSCNTSIVIVQVNMTKNIKVIAFMFILCACFVAPVEISSPDMRIFKAVKTAQIDAIRQKKDLESRQTFVIDMIKEGFLLTALGSFGKLELDQCTAVQRDMVDKLLADVSRTVVKRTESARVSPEYMARFMDDLENLLRLIREDNGCFNTQEPAFVLLCEQMQEILLCCNYQLNAFLEMAQRNPEVYSETDEMIYILAFLVLQTTLKNESQSASPLDRSMSSYAQGYDKDSTIRQNSPIRSATSAHDKPWSPLPKRQLYDQFSYVAGDSEPGRQAQPQPQICWRGEATIGLHDRCWSQPRLALHSFPLQQTQSSGALKPVRTDSETPASASNPLYSDFLTPRDSHDALLLSASKSPDTLEPENKRPFIGDRPVASPVNQSHSRQSLSSGQPPSPFTPAESIPQSPLRKTSQPQSVPGSPETKKTATPLQDRSKLFAGKTHPAPSTEGERAIPVGQGHWQSPSVRLFPVHKQDKARLWKPGDAPATPERVMHDTAHAQKASSSNDPSTPVHPDHLGYASPILAISPRETQFFTFTPNLELSDNNPSRHSLDLSLSGFSPNCTKGQGKTPHNHVHGNTEIHQLCTPMEEQQQLSTFLSWAQQTPTPPVADHDPAVGVTGTEEQESLKPTNRSLEDEFDREGESNTDAHPSSHVVASDATPSTAPAQHTAHGLNIPNTTTEEPKKTPPPFLGGYKESCDLWIQWLLKQYEKWLKSRKHNL